MIEKTSASKGGLTKEDFYNVMSKKTYWYIK
jgi:hypothetical protein